MVFAGGGAIMKCSKRRSRFVALVTYILVYFTFACGVLKVQAITPGTPLALGAGQEVRLDLPLDPQKTYEIKINLRSDAPNAEITLTLVAIRQNNEVVQRQIISENLGKEGAWHEIVFGEVKTPQNSTRWELILSANAEGHYWWQGLTVNRIYDSELSIQEYWSEKLATQGPFYTGLVVDARGLKVQRGMSPRIYSSGGQLLYGGVLASRDLVQERGVVTYGRELTEELLERLQLDPDYPYVAPLIVKAIGVADPAQTSVYISEGDTKRILEAMAQYDFFARYAVIFLVD